MRKSFFTLVLAIAAGVWTLSNAMCMGPFSDAMDQPYTTVSGTIQALPLPCEPGEDCPTCLTEAIVTNDKTYYLTTKNQQVADFLEQIQTSPVPTIYLLPLKATASGTPYQIGSFDYLLISSLNELSVEYFSDQQENKLPSLCDQWNVLAFRSHMGYAPDEYETQHYRLNSDTVINGIRFTKLYRDDTYSGAMREGTNRDIYYIPADSTHEYLLYTFNVQVGDTLPNNVWFGISNGDFLSIKTATIKEIKPTYPRTFVIDLEYWSHGILESSHTEREWIEGVGMPTAPDGDFFMPLAGGFSNILLCAYKNGEQVYVSDWGEQYGCEYNDDSHSTPIDTIPLFSYTGDDPGSSTVDPVDPNQVVATLNGNQLTIHENSGEEINYTLRHNTSAQTPALRMSPKADSFREEVTIAITESGEYTLQLTNPSWGYTIYGQFNYSPQGIDQIPVQAEENSEESHRKTRKIFINGHILIIRGGKTFTLSGQITDGQPTVNRQSKPR